MHGDPPLLSVPVNGTIAFDQFSTCLTAVGLPPYEQWSVTEYDTLEGNTRCVRIVNVRDGMSERLTFALESDAGQWRRTS